MEMENVVADKESCDFVTRITALPVVHAVMMSTVDVYQKAKESNGLVKCTLNTAEKTVLVAAEVAKPVIVKFEMPIVLANNLACMTLDKLEEKVPIIKKTPGEIAANTKNMYETTIIQPAMLRYNSAKAYSLQKANAAKDYGMTKATEVLETKYGHAFVDTLDTILIRADGYIDNYLPATQIEGQPEEPKIVNDGNPMNKAVVLSMKLKQRVLDRSLIKLQAAKKRMDEILADLHLTFNLMITRTNLDTTNKALMDVYNQAQIKVLKLWEDFNKGNPEVPGDKTLEQKLLFVVTQLTAQLNKTYQKTASTLALLPSHIQPAVVNVQNYITNLYSQFADAKSWDDVSGLVLIQMRDGIKNFQVLYTQLYNNALNLRAFSWLVPDIDLKDINLFEEMENDANFVRYISSAQAILNDNSSSEEDTVEFVMKPKWMQ